MLGFVAGDGDGANPRSGEVVNEADEGAAGVCEETVTRDPISRPVCGPSLSGGLDMDLVLMPMLEVLTMLKDGCGAEMQRGSRRRWWGEGKATPANMHVMDNTRTNNRARTFD